MNLALVVLKLEYFSIHTIEIIRVLLEMIAAKMLVCEIPHKLFFYGYSLLS
jgi:hypothetical protein